MLHRLRKLWSKAFTRKQARAFWHAAFCFLLGVGFSFIVDVVLENGSKQADSEETPSWFTRSLFWPPSRS